MYVYILFQRGIDEPRTGVQGSRDVYVGVAQDVHARLRSHNSGKCKATRGMQWDLKAHYSCQSYNSAFILERWLKVGRSLTKRLAFVAAYREHGSHAEAIREMETKALHWSLKRQLANPLPVSWK
jgi:predicted GIY-YIG superfamily endonuclease